MDIEDLDGISCNPGKDVFLIVDHMSSCSGDPVVPYFFLSWVEVWKFILTLDGVTFGWTDPGIILVIGLLLLSSAPAARLDLVHPGELDLPDGVTCFIPQNTKRWKKGVQFHRDVSITFPYIGKSLEHWSRVVLRLIGLVGAAEDFAEAGEHSDYVRI